MPDPGCTLVRASLRTLSIALAIALLAPLAAHAAPFAWADSVASYAPGLDDLSDPNSGFPIFSDPNQGLGPRNGTLVTLGEAGEITLGFSRPIRDGAGDDFVVFENPFFVDPNFGGPGTFAELAFVEVSTDGATFARFPTLWGMAGALPDAFFITDPNALTGFAGVRGGGDFFDLAALVGLPEVSGGLVDLANVRFVRLIDIVGDGGTLDDAANAILDPWPTGGFGTSGFDLDAVGVIPEPSALLLLGLGLAGVACARCGSSRSRSP